MASLVSGEVYPGAAPLVGNFFHIWDVVSGRLLDSRFFPCVENLHSGLWRIPLLAHTSYWQDRPTLIYIVSRTFGKEILPVTIDASDFLPPTRVGTYRILSLIIFLPLLITAVLTILYAAYWVLGHPDLIWKTVWGGLKKWLGIGAFTTS